MSSIIDQYSHIWGESPRQLLDAYQYQPELTRKLDVLRAGDFDRQAFYEIVLWKLNRFPQVEEGLIDSLKKVADLASGQHRHAEPQLRALLQCSGIALPMASTVLRFLNPQVFQIIDDRVYRIIHPEKPKYPTKPLSITEGYLQTSTSIYFDYLDALHELSSEEIPFSEADRILYQLDIALGNKIGDMYPDRAISNQEGKQ